MKYVSYVNQIFKEEISKFDSFVLYGQNVSAGSCLGGLTFGAKNIKSCHVLNTPNTKEYKNILKNLEVTGKSLLLTADLNKNVYLSSRNLPKSEVMTVKDANTYEILNADVLVISENSVNQLKESYEQI
jgi:ribosomal protein L4